MSGILSISDLMAARRGDDELVALGGGNEYFWPEFRQTVHATADRLLQHGGKNWLLACGDSYGFAAGFLAALYAGCNLTLPANLQSGHIAGILADMDGALGLESDRAAIRSDKFMPVLVPAPGGGKRPTASPPSFPGMSREIRIYTSGSSGAPTSITKPVRCLEAEVAGLEKNFGHQGIKNIVATVPPYHLYGLLFRILWPLLSKRSFSADTVRYPEELMGQIAQRPGAALIASPVFLKRALPFLDFPELNSRLCGIFSSGSPLNPEISIAYNTMLNNPIVEIYGSTETGGIAYRSVLQTDHPTHWTPFDRVELRSSDDGLLLVKSPHLSESGWMQTQDRVDIKENGQLELKGRADHVVKIEEHRVSLMEIESRLESDSNISAARVILMERGNRKILAAAAVPSEEGWRKLARIRKHEFVRDLRKMLVGHLPGIVLPKRWRFVRRFPESLQGKVTHAALSALFVPDRGRTTLPEVLSCKQAEGRYVFDLNLPENVSYFDGHFEGLPILPGIVHVNWAIHFARTHLAVKGVVEKMEKIKFSKILQPNTNVTMRIAYDSDGNRLAFSYASGEKKYSSGHVLFRPGR